MQGQPLPEKYTSKSTLKEEVEAGNNTFDFARKVDELDLKFRFARVLPDEKKVELQIFEKPQQAKDWVVFKAIEFPFINLYWAGTIVMVVGFLLSIFRRRKEAKTA